MYVKQIPSDWNEHTLKIKFSRFGKIEHEGGVELDTKNRFASRLEKQGFPLPVHIPASLRDSSISSPSLHSLPSPNAQCRGRAIIVFENLEGAIEAFPPLGRFHLDGIELLVEYEALDYTSTISSIIKARAVLFQMIPQLSFLTSLSIFISESPLFVFTDKLDFHLDPIVFSYNEAKKKVLEELGLKNSNLNDYQWIISCKTFLKIMQGSRLFKWLFGVYFFSLSFGILLLVGSYALMATSIVVISVHSFAISLQFVAIVGQFLDVTDDDLKVKFSGSHSSFISQNKPLIEYSNF